MLAGQAVAAEGTKFPAGENIFISMEAMFLGGTPGDGTELFELLAREHLLPEVTAPTVVRLRSIDSGWFPRELERERALMRSIAEAADAADAPTPVFILAPRGTAESRALHSTDFPDTEELLLEAGFEWLVNPSGVELFWDNEGVLPRHLGQRWLVFGVEHIGALEMTLCVDADAVVGWARSLVHTEPTLAGVGSFVDQCTLGQLDYPYEHVLGAEVLRELGADGEHFAVLLPRYAYEGALDSVALAEQQVVSAGLELFVVASDTLTADGEIHVSAEEHALLLADLGITVDALVEGLMPAWVGDFSSHRATLLLFSREGDLVESYFRPAVAVPGHENLSQTLFRLGYFD